MMRKFFALFLLCFVHNLLHSQENNFEITGKFGLKDKNTGELLIPETYQSLQFYHNRTVLSAKKEGKYGLLDVKGATLLAFEYDTLIAKVYSVTDQHIDVKYGIISKNGKFGLIDSLGKQITELHFDELPRFQAFQVSTVSVDGRFGLVGIDGKTLIPFVFDQVSNPAPGGMVVVKSDGKTGYYSVKGKEIIPPVFEKAQLLEYANRILLQKDGKWGAVDFTGKVVLPNEFDHLKASHSETSGYCFEAGKNGQFGILDSLGQVVIPIKFDEVKPRHPDYFLVKTGGKYGLFRGDGTEKLAPEYDQIATENNDQFHKQIISFRKSGKGYLLQEDGTFYDTTAFDDYFKFSQDFIILKKDKQYALADWFGHVRPGYFDEIDCDIDERKCLVSAYSKYGLIDYQGNIIIPLQFHYLDFLDSEKTYFLFGDEEGKLGVLTKDANILLPPAYEAISYETYFRNDALYYQNSLFHVKVNDRWGIVNSKGQYLIPCEYEEIGHFYNGKCAAKKDGKWGFINEKNKVVVPFQFEKVQFSENGVKKVFTEGKWFEIDENGKPIR